MTYHLRRLRVHGLIERIPHSHRYRLTSFGLRVALFFTRAYDHLLRPGFGAIMPALSCSSNPGDDTEYGNCVRAVGTGRRSLGNHKYAACVVQCLGSEYACLQYSRLGHIMRCLRLFRASYSIKC